MNYPFAHSLHVTAVRRSIRGFLKTRHRYKDWRLLGDEQACTHGASRYRHYFVGVQARYSYTTPALAIDQFSSNTNQSIFINKDELYETHHNFYTCTTQP